MGLAAAGELTEGAVRVAYGQNESHRAGVEGRVQDQHVHGATPVHDVRHIRCGPEKLLDQRPEITPSQAPGAHAAARGRDVVEHPGQGAYPHVGEEPWRWRGRHHFGGRRSRAQGDGELLIRLGLAAGGEQRQGTDHRSVSPG